MGCDIHMYAEVKKNGHWLKCGAVFDNPYHDPRRETYTEKDGYVWNAPKTEHPYRHRDYYLFSVLADVRNYRNEQKPWSQPRGIPADASKGYRDEVEKWGGDGHSHSFFTLAEIMQNEWATVKASGFVSAKDAESLDQTGKTPSSWWQSGNVPDQVWREFNLPFSKTWTEKTVPSLLALSTEDGLQDVRIVFFFDN